MRSLIIHSKSIYILSNLLVIPATFIPCFDLIANLSNRYYYEYSQDQVDKIFSALKERLNEAEEAFRKASSNTKEDFKL